MKRIFLALVLILALACPSFAGIGLYGNPTPLIINKDRNSPVLVALYDIDNTGFSAAEMAAITKVEVQYTPGTTGTTSEKIDSATYPAGFNWTTFAASHQLWMDIGLVAFTAGRDRKAELIIYTATWTAGRVVGLLDMQISADAVRDATTIDPLVTSIGLADINDVDTAGATGTVLTKKSDGTFDFQAPVIGDGTGDVIGPESAVDGNFASFDLTTGKLIKDSGSKAGDFAAASHNHTGVYIGDAPSDGAEYLRKDGAWAHPSASAITGSESAFDGWDKNAGDDLALGDLSTNAYYGDKGKTAYDHSQVAHAPTTAEQNVQSDWSEADTEADDYIKNKPSLFDGAYSSLSGLPTLFSGSYTDLTNIPPAYAYGTTAGTMCEGNDSRLHASGSDAETAATIATIAHGTSEKTTLVDGDEITGADSENSFSLIRTTWTNVKVFLKTYFDGLYAPLASSKTKTIQLGLIRGTDDLAVSDKQGDFTLPIPLVMNGWNLTDVEVYVDTAGTTGTTDFQIRNATDTADMLSTKATIDSTETSTLTAETAPSIDTTHDDVATGDLIAVDCDAISTTAPKGLTVELTFTEP